MLSTWLVLSLGTASLTETVLANTFEKHARAETPAASLQGVGGTGQHAGPAAKTGDPATGNTPYGLVQACAVARPGLTLSASSQEGDTATNTVYTVTLTNNDNPACGPSSFDLTVTYLPDGWQADLSPTRVNLSPGTTGKALLSVTSAKDTLTDNPRLQVAVSDTQVPAHAMVATPVYVANDTAAGTDDFLAAAMPAEPADGEDITQPKLAGGPGTVNVGDSGDLAWHEEATNHAAGGAQDDASLPASNSGIVDRDSRAEIAERLTLRMTGLLTAYNRADESARAHALDELVTAAEERHTLLTGLMEDDPGAVLRVAIPASVREGMPAEIRPFVEQRVDLEGNLVALYEDYPDGSARLRQFLEADGERYSLHFADRPPGLLTGTPVSASGVLLNDAMALESGENILTLAANGGIDGGSNGGTPAPLSDTFGEQRTVALLVNFASLQEEPWTVEEARSSVFGPASDFFLENSYGQTWLNGDVFGWFTIDLDPAGCPSTDIIIAANKAAGAQGIDLSGYSRVIYAFPNIGCSWSGLGSVGGNPSYAMFDGTLLDAGVVNHELGHNFGLRHSHALNCGTDVLGDTCTAYEYGDRLDRMGNPDKGHFNAFQKARLGWLGYQASPPIVTADSTGIYQLEPFESQTQGTKAIRILRDVDPVTGQRRWFYLESRQALGFDSFLATSNDGDSATNGLTFRTGVEGDPDSSYLLDMTPNSQAYDWLDFALPLGIGFTDAASGTTIALEQVGTSGATVSVNFGQPQCVHANPGLSASPLQGPWVPPGTPVSFDVTVTNNDSSACPEATLTLAGTVPEGWQSSFETPDLTLAPGANATATLTVTSPTTAADGFYPVEVMAVDQGNASYTATGNVTYVVASTDQPPVAVDDAGTTTAETPVSIAVLSNDSDPDGDPLTVITVDQPSNGSVQVDTSGSVTYEPATGFTGTETFAYTISDGQATASAMVSVNVKKGRGAKGGGNGKGPNK